MPTFVLSIQNNTSMVGWVSGIDLDAAKWVPDQAIAVNQPISAGANVQGLVAIALDTTTPVVDCSLTVQFGVPGVTASAGSGLVSVQFGAQLVNRTAQPFLGASESTPSLAAEVSLVTDTSSTGTPVTDTYVGFVTIEALAQA